MSELQDFMAGGTKGGIWRPQRVPTENVSMHQWGYNQVKAIGAPGSLFLIGLFFTAGPMARSTCKLFLCSLYVVRYP